MVPETQVLITITSHVVSPQWRHSLLYHLRGDPLERRRLVEFGQVMTQLLLPGTFRQSPYISFASPVTSWTLQKENDSGRLLPAVIARGKTLLKDHMAWINAM